jgi:hypothetical protein
MKRFGKYWLLGIIFAVIIHVSSTTSNFPDEYADHGLLVGLATDGLILACFAYAVNSVYSKLKENRKKINR